VGKPEITFRINIHDGNRVHGALLSYETCYVGPAVFNGYKPY
jgi:hypothetical protein